MNDQLREYTLKIVTLGQEALRVRRDGDWLPDDLAALADELLALEGAFGAPAEADAPAGQPVDEAYMATEMPLEAPYPPIPAAEEAGAEAVGIEDVNVEEADIDEWPTQPYETPVTSTPEAEPLPDDAILVLDVEEEPDSDALAEAIVVDDAAIEDAPAPESVAEAATDATAWLDEWPEPEEAATGPAAAEAWLASPADEPAPQPEPELSAAAPVAVDEWPAAPIEEATPLPEPEAPSPAPAPSDEPRFCINCGEKLRPGKRFCHRCGTPVSEMFPGSASEKPAPAVVSAEAPAAPAPFLFAPPPPPPPPVERPAELTRFCNNCGLGVAAGVTVCPDCGSRDIS